MTSAPQDFAAVQPIDDQGRPVGGAADTGDAPAETATATASSEAPAATSTGTTSTGDFGSCSTPEIKFGVGLDNRKETAFEPADKNSFDHGSAQNIDIITRESSFRLPPNLL